MSETELLMQAAGRLGQQLHDGMAQWADAMSPGWRERAERAGYQGARCGWYPAKPRGWRP